MDKSQAGRWSRRGVLENVGAMQAMRRACPASRYRSVLPLRHVLLLCNMPVVEMGEGAEAVVGVAYCSAGVVCQQANSSTRR